MKINNLKKSQFSDFISKEEMEPVLMYNPVIDPLLTQQMIINNLRNTRQEPHVFWPLKAYVYHGFEDFKKEVEDELNNIMWVLQFIWKINGAWHNLSIGWPTYPNHISINKKPVGKPYSERIKYSFEKLQWCVDHYYYVLYKFFGNYINHEAWEMHLEWTLESVCKAYADPINDEFGLRKGLKIVRPDEQDVREINGEVLYFKRDWAYWKNNRKKYKNRKR